MIKNVTLCILSFQGLSSLRNYPFVYIDILGFKIVIFFMILLLKKINILKVKIILIKQIYFRIENTYFLDEC